MPSKVEETRQRILDMLEQKRVRRQNGDVSLADKILNQGKSPKAPKVPRLPKK